MVTFATPTGTNNIGILGIGAYRPQRLVANDEICANLDVDSEWIYTRTGIKSRRFCGRDESITTMSVEAGRAALANSGLTGADIDALLLATSTHGRCIPSAAPPVATAVGANGVPAMDVSVGCAGFGYAMSLAQDMIRSGSATRVLVIGAEEISMSLDMTDPGVSFIFGDGAGAVVVGPSDVAAIGPTVWGSKPEAARVIEIDDWREVDPEVGAHIHMDGREVFKWATTAIVQKAVETLEASGLTPDELDCFIPHQANNRITDSMLRHLKLPEGVVVGRDIVRMGNSSAASIPLAMEALLESGQAKSGDSALIIGFGAGLVFAGQTLILP